MVSGAAGSFQGGTGNSKGTIREPLFRKIAPFAAVTGLRRGEFMNLKWERFDLGRKIIHVVNDATYRTKGGRQRILPTSDVCHALLSARAARADGEFVFMRRGRPLYADGLYRELKKYVRLLGLDRRLHFHSLRHSFASWLAQANVSIYPLKKLLGHSSIQATQMYSHLTPSELHGVVNKIDVGRN
jgi:integrase